MSDLGHIHSQFVRAAMSAPYLGRDEEHQLARRLREDEGLTLEMIGRRLGLSKERVRQIENRALEKLRAALLLDSGEAFMSPA